MSNNNWRDKRKAQRDHLLKESIERITERAKKDEYIVRSIETEDVAVLPLGRHILTNGKRRIETDRFMLLSDDIVTFEAGSTKKEDGDDVVLVRIEDFSKGKEVSLVFEGTNALDEAISTFQGISIMLRCIKRERRMTE